MYKKLSISNTNIKNMKAFRNVVKPMFLFLGHAIVFKDNERSRRELTKISSKSESICNSSEVNKIYHGCCSVKCAECLSKQIVKSFGHGFTCCCESCEHLRNRFSIIKPEWHCAPCLCKFCESKRRSKGSSSANLLTNENYTVCSDYEGDFEDE